jgi:hypothetical protein
MLASGSRIVCVCVITAGTSHSGVGLTAANGEIRPDETQPSESKIDSYPRQISPRASPISNPRAIALTLDFLKRPLQE